MTAPRNAWIEGLCTWRALLMLGGIVLHATIGHEGYAPFAAINMVSNAFRMGVFFVASGLLSAFAVQRRADPVLWLRQRLVRLGIPTLFGLTVICPLTAAMLSTGIIYPRGPMTSLPNMFHFWFLVALIGYTLLGFGFERADRRWHMLERADRELRSPLQVRATMLLGTGAACFVLMVAGVHLGSEVLAPGYSSMATPLRLMTGYAPLFAVGFAAARMPRWRTATIYEPRMPVAILLFFVAANVLWWSGAIHFSSPATHRWIEEVLIIATGSWCPPAAAALILRAAITVQHAPPLLRRLSDASYTMYILHYPVIVATKLAVAPLALGPWGEFAVSVATGGGLTYWLHDAVVARSPVLMLLLNGQHGCTRAGRAAST